MSTVKDMAIAQLEQMLFRLKDGTLCPRKVEVTFSPETQDLERLMIDVTPALDELPQDLSR